jgi:hypothetical protein
MDLEPYGFTQTRAPTNATFHLSRSTQTNIAILKPFHQQNPRTRDTVREFTSSYEPVGGACFARRSAAPTGLSISRADLRSRATSVICI